MTDYDNGVIHKYDENLSELKTIRVNEEVDTTNDDDYDQEERRRKIEEREIRNNSSSLDGPCGIAINNELKQIQVIDQNNMRIVFLSLADESFVGAFRLFQEDLQNSVKHVHVVPHDLSVNVNYDDHLEVVKKRVQLDFRPFGLCTRNERF